jgi:hypothetical protein
MRNPKPSVVRPTIIVLALLAHATATARAQTADSVSAVEAGRRDGRAYAEGAPVGDRFALAVVAGIPVGLFALSAKQGDAVGLLAVTAGGGTVLLASHVGARTPEAHRQRASARGQQYAQAFDRAYRETLQQRYRRAAVTGGVVGAVVGVLTLLWGLSQLTT